jgi:transcriptional regulator PpsR
MSSPEIVQTLIRTVSDIAVITDSEGRIEEVSCNVDELAELGDRRWVGLPLVDTVTEECRGKIESMLAAAAANEEPRWRQINHVFEGGEEVPIRYQAFGAGEGRVIFLGREERSVAQLQSRLVRAQQALDQDYGRLRQMETRYRVLFQTSSEPLVIADAETKRIQEANAAAGRLLGEDPQDLAGVPLARLFHDDDRQRLDETLERLRGAGGSAPFLGHDPAREHQIDLRLTLFRAAESIMLLGRLKPIGAVAERESVIEQMLVGMVGRMAEAVVVTDLEGGILWCNDAFLGMAEIALPEQIRGEPLARFLSRPGVDMDVILANARTHGRLRAFASVLRGAFGSTTRVEISAANLPNENPPAIGFVMRDISRNAEPPAVANGTSSKSVDNLIELVGSVPLKELVRASTDEIEKMCIETALRMTGNNRASAAEMLGLSRQSLYVKLRRFGLIDQDQAD